MTKQEAEELLDKYAEGACTPEEKALIERWYLQELSEKKLPDEPEDHFSAKSEMWEAIREISGLQEAKERTKKISLWISAAASIIFIMSAGIYFYKQQKPVQLVKAEKPVAKEIDIDPGVNKAVLTLADGSKILLDDKGQGLIATESGIKINKQPDGSITYEVSSQLPQPNAPVAYNTIETPKGGKYQIVLPDGSKVWLNAASSLRFPATFTGKERDVELTGEAYFEVSKNKLLPFRVHTKDMNVFVTGTQFNIMAYNDEIFTATTLIEGSVDVRNSSQNMSLIPGEQVVSKPGLPLDKKDVDVHQAIAWKNGLFQFSNSDIRTVMRQIERWYDVSVEYRGKIPLNHFGGYISRDSKLSQVIKILELSGVKFSIEEKKIIVLP